MSEKTRALRARIDSAQVARSICPYCGVGCGQLVFHDGKKIISIEGDPESPISQGNLCPKGAASYQLLTHSRRETKVKYRAPRAKSWTEISLDRAMEMVADRVWESRKRNFIREKNGPVLNHTEAIAHRGGATLDNEENYLIKKLFAGGPGWLIRGGEIFSGPLSIILRLTSLIPLAAISFFLGALLSRFGWIAAGRVSGRDPEAVFASQA